MKIGIGLMGRAWAVFVAMTLALMLTAPLASAQASKQISFNHDRTGFPLVGAHAREQCDSCHSKGIFKGTPKQCVSCHVKGSQTATTSKHDKHVPTRDACSLCHNVFSWTPARMSHNTVVSGGCVTCHSGAFISERAEGRTANHAAISGLPNNQTDQCDTCHRSTTSWIANTHLHGAGDQGKCSSCHNGRRAVGVNSGHIPTNLTAGNCDTCHTSFTTFAPANMNHAGMGGKCSTCHSGNYLVSGAVGKPADHSATFMGSNNCDGCHSASAINWVVSFNHATRNPAISIGDHTCSNCHGASATSPGLKLNASQHIPTGSAFCDNCHKNFTDFGPAMMDHNVVASVTCSTCHGQFPGRYVSQGAEPYSLSHIPFGSAACSVCHTNFSSFQPATMSHSLTGNDIGSRTCNTCHSGSYLAYNAQAKTTTHVKTNATCDDCHKSTTSWATVSFDHAGNEPPVVIGGGTCATCHVAGGGGLSMPTTHIPTPLACDTCHTSFASFNLVKMNHTGVSDCTVCHNGSFIYAGASAKANDHIPTSRDCAFCHTNFTAFAPAEMNHTLDAAGKCATCHGGNFTRSNAQTKPADAVHNKGGVTAQCDSCHLSTSSWATASFNHAAASPPVAIGGGTCVTCHVAGGGGLSMPVTHIPSGSVACDTCHTNFNAFDPAKMNHAGADYTYAATACSNCHNGNFVSVNAQNKSTTHLTTTAECGSCHQSFTTWTTAIYDHAANGVTLGAGTCATCHNGKQAIGKATSHLPTTAACDTCHTNFTAFSPAQMNHAGAGYGIGSHACATCHSGNFAGVNAQSKTASHVITTAECDTCHTSLTNWASAVSYSHDVNAPGRCSTCHISGGSALAKNATHIPTSAQCDSCHKTYIAFAPASMSHTGLTACTDCHNGQNFGFQVADARSRSTSHIPLLAGAQCSLCHTNFATFQPAQMSHTGSAGKCDTCHNGSYLSSNAQAKSSSHVVDTRQCDTCHTSTTTWATVTYAHKASDTVCDSCHKAGGAGLPKPATHIPTTAQCSTCHKNYTAFAPAQMSHAGTSGPLAVGNCTTCHNGSFLSQGTLGALAKPGNHITTALSCDSAGCHTNTVNYTSWVTTYTHQATDTNCSSCHNGTQAPGKLATHIPTTAQCSTCHKNTVAFAPASMSHTGTTGPLAGIGAHTCATCHNGSFLAVNALAKTAAHVTTALECDTCHSSTTDWASGVNYKHTATDTVCDSCHKSGGTGLSKPTNHIPTVSQCNNCHTNPIVTTSGYSFAYTGASLMNHTGLPTCTSCHNGTYTSQGIQGALAKNVSHFPTSGDCVLCHSTDMTKAFQDGTTAVKHNVMVGPVAVGNCVTCHSGGFSGSTIGPVKSKDATHFPTSRQCDTCHSGYVSFATTYTMNHAGTTGLCSTCHNGTFSTADGLLYGKNGKYPHFPTVSECDFCHTSTSTFTQLASVSAIHTGAAGKCSTCHNGSYSTADGNLYGMPATGHPSTTGAANCDTCHINTVGYTSWASATYSHQPADEANCGSSCHVTGLPGLPKNAGHIPPLVGGDRCGVCHTNKVSFKPASMNHAAMTSPVAAGNCATCHNGSFLGVNAQAKQANHIAYTPSNKSCDSSGCHDSTHHNNYSTWVTTFVHASTDTTCNSCHKTGGSGLAPSGTHIPTTAQCSQCHVNPAGKAAGTYTFAYTGASLMNHTGLTACSSCHNGSYLGQGITGALAKTSFPNHTVTTSECTACHASAQTKAFTSWEGAGFAHAATDTVCNSCHKTGGTAQGMPTGTHIPTTAQCSTCHTNPIGRTAGTYSFAYSATTLMNHTGATACATCHNGSYTSQGITGAKAKPAGTGHIPTTAQCSLCHKSFTSFAKSAGGMTMDHTGLADCRSCHGSSTYVPMGLQTYPNDKLHTGGAVTVSTAQCSACHTNTLSFTTWNGGLYHKGATTTTASGTCTNCHNGTVSGADPEPSNHSLIDTGLVNGANMTCNQCHTIVTAWTVSRLGAAGHNNSLGYPSASGRCTVCHNTGASFPGSLQKKSLGNHEGSRIAGTNDCSMSGCHRPLGGEGSSYSSW